MTWGPPSSVVFCLDLGLLAEPGVDGERGDERDLPNTLEDHRGALQETREVHHSQGAHLQLIPQLHHRYNNVVVVLIYFVTNWLPVHVI